MAWLPMCIPSAPEAVVETVGQELNSAGISRLWIPDRNRQITPVRCSRGRSAHGTKRPIDRQL